MKYREILSDAKKRAISLDKEDYVAVLILQHLANVEPHIFVAILEDEASSELISSFNIMFNQYLYGNRPVQYILNNAEFYGYNFYVDECVLIPRQETEELVANVLSVYDEIFENQKVKLVDIGTGSGAIAISLALEESNFSVSASDISEGALNVSKTNAKKLNAFVNFKLGSMLEPFYEEKFDILVSNPPYIPTSEEVCSIVLDNEPDIALFGGDDGLKFYRIILENASKILNKKNILAFEHAFDKAQELKELVLTHFPKAEVRQFKDTQGKDRMTIVINHEN